VFCFEFKNTEGAVTRNSITNVYEYEYALRDHLGNTRATFADANNDGIVTSTDIRQINHYYPFGLNMEGNWTPSGANGGGNKYQYNGKELNEDFGLGWNDYGARFYDAAIGRFSTVDPLSPMMPRHSSYSYAFNNPMRFTDPTGMAPQSADGMSNEDWVNKTRRDGGYWANEAKSMYIPEPKSSYQRIMDLNGHWHNINEEDVEHIKGVHAVTQKYTPEIYGFTSTAFKAGKPNILHYDKDKAMKDWRRRKATKSLKGRGKDGLQRDEYPYAMTKEGGPSAMVAYVSEKEQLIQAIELGAVTSKLETGDAFIVILLPDVEDARESVFVPEAARKRVPQPTSFMDKMEQATGLTGAALILYIIVSEGSRLFPPRNLVPVP
jgi:RHS repeat-associated protein